VFFILAVFSFIGYWNTEGAFIGLYIGLVKNLIGHGFFALPPVLMACAVILTFNKDQPVRSRTVCTLLLCVLAGALAHLFTRESGYEYAVSLDMFAELWESGALLLSGGALSGALADTFGWLFGGTGSAAVLICISLLLFLSTLNITIAGIVESIRNRERREYVPERRDYNPGPAPEYDEQAQQPTVREMRPKRSRAIHIPLDGDERARHTFHGEKTRPQSAQRKRRNNRHSFRGTHRCGK
jgi:S-DNA-T family DNA segregation ATPase FtsK/SpoIIIE